MLNEYSGGGQTFKLLFGEKTGEILSRVQGTVVSAGTHLQNIIKKLCGPRDNLSFQVELEYPNEHRNLKVDILITDDSPMAIELKLGYEFDTKKASKEVEDVTEYAGLASVRYGKEVTPAIAFFNAKNHNQIDIGFKAGDTHDVALLTGPELCNRLNLNYHEVEEGLSKYAANARAELLVLLTQAVHEDED